MYKHLGKMCMNKCYKSHHRQQEKDTINRRWLKSNPRRLEASMEAKAHSWEKVAVMEYWGTLCGSISLVISIEYCSSTVCMGFLYMVFHTFVRFIGYSYLININYKILHMHPDFSSFPLEFPHTYYR